MAQSARGFAIVDAITPQLANVLHVSVLITSKEPFKYEILLSGIWEIEKFHLEQMRFIRPKRAKAIAPIINDYSINTLSHPAGSSSVRLTIYNKSLQAQKTDPGRFQSGTFRFEAKLDFPQQRNSPLNVPKSWPAHHLPQTMKPTLHIQQIGR
jgi:hypothetical protein